MCLPDKQCRGACPKPISLCACDYIMHAEVVPEYNESCPEEIGVGIDRNISLLRAQTVDPALDPSKSIGERQQFMELPPAARVAYGGATSSGPAGRPSMSAVEWLPYSNTREKLESWIAPPTNDYSNQANMMRQMSKAEKY
jgi:hypothetical protein